MIVLITQNIFLWNKECWDIRDIRWANWEICPGTIIRTVSERSQLSAFTLTTCTDDIHSIHHTALLHQLEIGSLLDFSVRVVYWVLPTRTRITKFKISYNTYWAVLYTRFDCKVLVIDSNIKIVMIEGEEKSKHTQKRRKTNSRRRAKEQMQRSKEQPSNITVQHQLYCYTLSYYIIWYSSRSGVEWHFKFLKTR